MSTLKAGHTIKRLWKEGWINIPEVMASHVLSTIGIIGVGCLYIYTQNNTMITRSCNKPLFLRPDDPRAKKTITYYEEGWDRK